MILQVLIFPLQFLVALNVGRVLGNAINRADFHTLAGFKVTHTFRTAGPVDLVDNLALEDGVIGTFRLTYIAVDAFVCDVKCHDRWVVVSAGLSRCDRLV